MIATATEWRLWRHDIGYKVRHSKLFSTVPIHVLRNNNVEHTLDVPRYSWVEINFWRLKQPKLALLVSPPRYHPSSSLRADVDWLTIWQIANLSEYTVVVRSMRKKQTFRLENQMVCCWKKFWGRRPMSLHVKKQKRERMSILRSIRCDLRRS